jgi:hypothetical protein
VEKERKRLRKIKQNQVKCPTCIFLATYGTTLKRNCREEGIMDL